MSSTIEHRFITREPHKTFNMIEDESGDIFWGYGHRDGPEFIEEVNGWLIHACVAIDPDDLFATSTKVEHLWARFVVGNDERFELVRPAEVEFVGQAFPVTRLIA